LELSCIRDVKTGKYACTPKDKYLKDVLSSGKSSAPVPDKTITICYGPDLVNVLVLNFVCVADNADEVAREWTEFLFQCAENQRMQNLSPWESLAKLRSCLVYGKAVVDEKSRMYKLPVQT
jgi:phosphatidylinositol phospholipase C beta